MYVAYVSVDIALILTADKSKMPQRTLKVKQKYEWMWVEGTRHVARCDLNTMASGVSARTPLFSGDIPLNL